MNVTSTILSILMHHPNCITVLWIFYLYLVTEQSSWKLNQTVSTKQKKKLLGRGSNLLAAVSHGKGKRNQLQPNQRIWLILLFFLPKRREAANMAMKPVHPNAKNKNELKTY